VCGTHEVCTGHRCSCPLDVGPPLRTLDLVDLLPLAKIRIVQLHVRKAFSSGDGVELLEDLSFREGHLCQFGLDAPLDLQHPILIVLRDEADRNTALARTRRPSDSVRVLLRLVRHVPVDHDGDVFNIQAARANIRRDQHRHDKTPEQVERVQPLLLRQPRVQRRAAYAERFEQVREVRGGARPPAEDDRRRWLLEWVFVVFGGLLLGRLSGLLRPFARMLDGFWRGAPEVERGFGRVAEEIEEIGFAYVGWDEDVVLFQSRYRLDAARRGERCV